MDNELNLVLAIANAINMFGTACVLMSSNAAGSYKTFGIENLHNGGLNFMNKNVDVVSMLVLDLYISQTIIIDGHTV